MKKSATSFVVAALLLGAGLLAWWKVKTPDVQAPAEQTSSASPNSSDRNPDGVASRFSKLTDPSIRWQVRVDMLRRLDAESLSQKDIETLYTLLTHSPVSGQEEKWWVVVNEIMEQMRKQGIGPDRYSKDMLAIITDSTAPEVLRDYAIQHLGQWVTPRGEALGQPSEQDLALVRQSAETFAETIKDPNLAHTSIPGTTLMVLVDMKGGGVSEEILTPVVESISPWLSETIENQSNTSKITRISAINAVGMLQLLDLRPAIRQLAKSDSTDASIRLNSIATLGQIGEEDDLETLQSLSTSTRRYRHAAQAALANLQVKVAADE